MIDRKILGYFSMIFSLTFCAALLSNGQFIMAGFFATVYIILIFGVDKFKLDLKKKTIEIEDDKKE